MFIISIGAMLNQLSFSQVSQVSGFNLSMRGEMSVVPWFHKVCRPGLFWLIFVLIRPDSGHFGPDFGQFGRVLVHFWSLRA